MVFSANYTVTSTKSKKLVSTPDGMSSENDRSSRSLFWPTTSLSRTSSYTNNSPGTLVLPSSEEVLDEFGLVLEPLSNPCRVSHPQSTTLQNTGSPFNYLSLRHHVNATVPNPPPHVYGDLQGHTDGRSDPSPSFVAPPTKQWLSTTYSSVEMPVSGSLGKFGGSSAFSIVDESEDTTSSHLADATSVVSLGVGVSLPVMGRRVPEALSAAGTEEEEEEGGGVETNVVSAVTTSYTDGIDSVPLTDQYRTSLLTEGVGNGSPFYSVGGDGDSGGKEEEEEEEEWCEDQEEQLQQGDEEEEEEEDVLNSILLIANDESNQVLQRCKRIGLGGDRGSSVYEVSKEKLQRNLLCKTMHLSSNHETIFNRLKEGSYAYKVYPRPIPPHEVHFALRANPHRISNDPECAKEVIYGFLHLLLPIAYVEISDEKRAMILPLFCCSLRFFLQNYIPLNKNSTARITSSSPAVTPVHRYFSPGQGVEDRGENSRSFGTVMENGSSSSSLLSEQRYMPVRSTAVITAIAYQLLTAINVCNHHVPHTDYKQEVEYQGFTHNDIHLDNLLLNAQGRLSLCDFELVAPLPRNPGARGGGSALLGCSSSHSSPLPRSISSSCSVRIPPYSRQSPEGLCAPNADMWAFGLVLINLLTGVDPLFSSKALLNDFGNGPILKPWTGRKEENCVDWERNIKPHIYDLMSKEESNTLSVEEASGILHLCSRCLVNTEGRQSATAEELLRESIFDEYRNHPFSDEQVVAKWIAEHPSGASTGL